MKKVTKSDIGGGGLKFGIFALTSFLNGPLKQLHKTGVEMYNPLLLTDV